MRVVKYILMALMIGGIVFLSLSCTGNTGATSTPKPQIVTVQRGNISITVIGTGSLALENKQELSFGQTGLVSQASNAKIAEVDVVAGQLVDQGQVLVKADTTDWQDQITTDQHNLDSAKASLAQVQASLIQAQNTLTNDQNALSQQADVQAIQDKIDNANIQLQTAQVMLQQATQSSDPNALNSVQYWQSQIAYYSIDTNPQPNNPKHKADNGLIGVLTNQMSQLLTDPAHYLASSVTGSASSVAAIKKLQMTIQQDQANVVTVQNNIVTAQNKVDDAQTTLNNDQSSAQEIDAPFRGLITKVYTDSSGNPLSKGVIVQRSANLIEIADPNKFVANILVTEQDVMSVKMGGDATVSFNALTGLNFPAKITQIAPLATVQQGVVNYQITVELTSLTPIFPNRTGQNSSPSANGTPFSTRIPGASPAGTPSPTGATSPEATASPTSAPAATIGGTPSPTSTPTTTTGGTPPAGTFPTITLKDGLSATVTIPVQEKDNILMVPSRAITRQGRNATVQVVKGTTTETVTVQTGITDGTNTEITSGLNEGDQVLVQPRPTSTTTSGFGGPPGGLGLR